MSIRIDASQSSSPIAPAAHEACTDTSYEISNSAAKPTAAGPAVDQVEQAAHLLKETALNVGTRLDSDRDVTAARALKTLQRTPPDLTRPTEYVDYTSTLKNVSADAAFEYFKQNPTAWFGASGVTLHPAVGELKDGARLFLEEPGVTPPVWAPVEVRIDERARTVEITTLDGHPLRGTNRFSFDEDAQGHATMRQSSAFQMSSFASEGGGEFMRWLNQKGVPLAQDPIERQHDIWSAAHANIADHAKRH